MSKDQTLIAATEEAAPGWLHILTVTAAQVPLTTPPTPRGKYREESDSVHEAPHNVYGIGTTAYLSHYTAGFQLIDLTDPALPIRRAFYDTYPATPAGSPQDLILGSNCGGYQTGFGTPPALPYNGYFRGAYDCYPYADSGYVYVTDVELGLFVLEVEAGHFFRSDQGYASVPNGPVPNMEPSAATPQTGRPFQFRLMGLQQAPYKYDFRLTAAAATEEVAPIGWLVSGTDLVQVTDGSADSNGEAFVTWSAQFSANTNLYAQVIEKDSQQGNAVGSSRLIRFRLLP